jgi:hypothetical protein
MITNTQDLAVAVLASIDKYGWRSGPGRTDDGKPMCLVQHAARCLRKSNPGPDGHEERFRLRMEFQRDAQRIIGTGLLVDFNDAEGRTEDEVRALLMELAS